jgi:hypothetical protein
MCKVCGEHEVPGVGWCDACKKLSARMNKLHKYGDVRESLESIRTYQTATGDRAGGGRRVFKKSITGGS